MIGYLRGVVKDSTEESILLEVAGVGYEVAVSASNLFDLQAQTGQVAELWVYTHVREDALQLYGFISPEEKSFFLTLLKVNGVGPKLALGILGGASVSVIAQMIEDEDIKGLTRLPKVGKKTAEQMVLSLKGKLVLADDKGKPKSVPAQSNLVSALVNLGYKPQEVEKIIGDIPTDLDLQESLRRGLQLLTKSI